ncbi:MAG TPA: two-component system response regulator [Candidatus Margulisbacteria bacterium]|nr:MAG: hypothetical protein A2X43_01165 [Candidatus Margulisbacteria bacterium GWD2_39_127]OGI03330.1 MAG: hypothetical protein A2X42_06950 [Candidatus Margulisbacteria bacterium GWF2_38_17]OGI12014.1 MAG: hypothetical protein A2X41_03030 [Candidatus Margulisbacteria bacterium GWE2_39_32]HAR63172.1 two-component system response regulator [Candidatus Margulisiibacteriota bacterium]HCT84988.1 two-component system response regulator [Candidatus Margulisiibacteriota bacterium]
MKKKILVVDDEPSIVQTLKLLLEMEGYEVYTANNGQVGYEKAMEVLPNLVIIDFKMPILDGWEATKRMRQVPGLENIPILGNTAYASEENIIQGIESGITEVVRKPFNIEKLQNLVKRYLGE